MTVTTIHIGLISYVFIVAAGMLIQFFEKDPHVVAADTRSNPYRYKWVKYFAILPVKGDNGKTIWLKYCFRLHYLSVFSNYYNKQHPTETYRVNPLTMLSVKTDYTECINNCNSKPILATLLVDPNPHVRETAKQRLDYLRRR